LQAEPQLMLDTEQFAGLSGHLGTEDLVATAPRILCGVHRDIRVADELFAVARARIEDDADTCPERDFAARDGDSSGDAVQQPLRQSHYLALSDTFEEQRELVPAKASHCVAFSHDLLEPARDLRQQLVAGIVAETVVHLLEAVEVDEEDGDELAGALGACESLVEPITEQGSIRQAGQVVVERLMRQLLLDLDSFRDVSRVEDDATDPPLLSEIGHMCLETPPLAGGVEHPKHDLGRAAVN